VTLAQTFLQRFAQEEGKQFTPWAPNIWQGCPHGPGRAMCANCRMSSAARPCCCPRAARLPVRRPAHSAGPRPLSCCPVARAGRDDTGPDRAHRHRNRHRGGGGSLPTAARSLGVSPSTLYRKRERWAETQLSA
jgi:two-component system repressor protein LuxO